MAGSGPTSTTDQIGELKRLVDWLDGAWLELQQMARWDWMWEAATVTILADTYVTAGSIPARRYDRRGTFNSTQQVTFIPWETFRLEYPAAQITSGVPLYWSIRPDKAFVVSSKPTANLALSVERWKNPSVMDEDADVPEMPSEHHMAIVWKAMMMYCNFEEAGVSRATTKAKLDFHMTALGLNEERAFEIGEPLC